MRRQRFFENVQLSNGSRRTAVPMDDVLEDFTQKITDAPAICAYDPTTHSRGPATRLSTTVAGLMIPG